MPKRGTITDKTMRTQVVVEVISEQTGNMTGNHFKTDGPNRAVRRHLEAFARQVVHMAINTSVDRPDLHSDWKGDFVNATEKTLEAKGMEELIQDTLTRISLSFPKKVKVGQKSGLFHYSLYKIATYAGQVSRMIKVGLDPKFLSMNNEEASEHLANMLTIISRSGVPTTVLVHS